MFENKLGDEAVDRNKHLLKLPITCLKLYSTLLHIMDVFTFSISNFTNAFSTYEIGADNTHKIMHSSFGL